MTIDMLRHTSLREIVARALYDSPPSTGTWPVPTAAHGASFAVRNLPHDTDPERAVHLMEATVAAAPELKRRHGVKGWRVRVRKPALGYTLHWQEGPPSDEELLIHETLELLPAAELQAVIIRRGHGQTSRTAVVLNTVHPPTGLVKVNGQVYFDLLHCGARPARATPKPRKRCKGARCQPCSNRSGGKIGGFLSCPNVFSGR